MPFNSLDFDVIIVEGHYNPIVANAQTRRLNEQVRANLASLGDRVTTRYVLRKDVLEFEAEDYYVLTHEEMDVGDRSPVA